MYICHYLVGLIHKLFGLTFYYLKWNDLAVIAKMTFFKKKSTRLHKYKYYENSYKFPLSWSCWCSFCYWESYVNHALSLRKIFACAVTVYIYAWFWKWLVHSWRCCNYISNCTVTGDFSIQVVQQNLNINKNINISENFQ